MWLKYMSHNAGEICFLCHQIIAIFRACLLVEKVSVILCPYCSYRNQLTEVNHDSHTRLCKNHAGELDTPNISVVLGHREFKFHNWNTPMQRLHLLIATKIYLCYWEFLLLSMEVVYRASERKGEGRGGGIFYLDSKSEWTVAGIDLKVWYQLVTINKSDWGHS